jgi:hypothetical protein
MRENTMRFDINETLLRHIATGGGSAFILREAASDGLLGLISELFAARSDVRRLDQAQKVARAVLHINDFADIMDLRDIVAQQELRRLIAYSKQKDHTAHTVYLYLLGIWFFDHVSVMKSAILHRSGCKTDREACEWFLERWLFASLLHDIGYAFYDLSEFTAEDRRRIDGIYSWKWLENLFTATSQSARILKKDTLAKLRSAHNKWEKIYSKRLPAPTSRYAPGAYVEVINRLAAAPWLGDLNPEWKDKDIFDVLTLGYNADLRSYALTVAEEGYVKGGRNGCVDHAVASGLLLFQYCSYWYWLMDQLRSDAKAFKDATGGFDYDLKNMHTWIVDACRSAAYHNVQPSVSGADAILRSITLQKDPVLYLAIICDELQTWDRYPAGDAILRQFQQTAAASLEGGDIELTCSGTDIRTGRFRIEHDQQSDIVKKMKSVLAVRAPGYQQIVSIEGI